MKECYKRVLILMVDVAKAGARIGVPEYFAGTLSAIARHLGLKVRGAAGNVGASGRTARASVTPGMRFSLISDSR